MNITRKNAQLREMANEAHHSAIEAHGETVPAALAWEFITQANPDYEAWIGEPMPRIFKVHYSLWDRVSETEFTASEVQAIHRAMEREEKAHAAAERGE